jgi:hypothetical protein
MQNVLADGKFMVHSLGKLAGDAHYNNSLNIDD